MEQQLMYQHWKAGKTKKKQSAELCFVHDWVHMAA